MRAGCFVKTMEISIKRVRGQGEVEFSIDFSSFMSQSPYVWHIYSTLYHPLAMLLLLTRRRMREEVVIDLDSFLFVLFKAINMLVSM